MQTTSLNKVSMTPIAGLTTDIPNSDGQKFTTFGKPVSGVNSIAFYGSGSGNQGIYLQVFLGVAATASSLEVVCDLSTHLPTIGKPTALGDAPNLVTNGVYFWATNGTTQGIFHYDITTKQIGEVYTCEHSATLSAFSGADGRLAFEQTNAADPTKNGIWLIGKEGNAELIITTGPSARVQILGRPMDANNYLLKTGTPFLDGDQLVFVGELKNSPTGQQSQSLIRYGLSSRGLLSILKDGDTLPNGNQLVGNHAFQAPLAFRDGVIAATVQYNDSNQPSTKSMVISISSDNSITEVANNMALGPNGVLYTNEFATAPMTARGRIAFVSDVEVESDQPSTNLLVTNSSGVLENYLEGASFPYGGKSYLQGIQQVATGFEGEMIAARCFWNDGYSDQEDLLGIYAFFLK